MWYGKNTPRLLKAKEDYREVFGYDPDDELGVEYNEGEEDQYINDIYTCIRENKEIGNLFADDILDFKLYPVDWTPVF